MQNLRILNFFGTALSDSNIASLASSNFLKYITELTLRRCPQLTDTGIQTITNSDNFGLLTYLDIGYNEQLTAWTAEYLAMTKTLKFLARIKFAGCKAIDDKALKNYLMKTQHHLSLREIEIDEV